MKNVNTVETVLALLLSKADPAQLDGMQRFGMTKEGRLGVKVPEMRKIAKGIGKDHELALALWETGIIDARIVASMVAEPDKLTEDQMERWVKDINSWDLCDQLCMNLFEQDLLPRSALARSHLCKADLHFPSLGMSLVWQ